MAVTFVLADTLSLARVPTLTISVGETFIDKTEAEIGAMDQTVLYGAPIVNSDSVKLIPYDEE